MKTSRSGFTTHAGRIGVGVVLSMLALGCLVLLNPYVFGLATSSGCSKEGATRAGLATIKNAINQYKIEQGDDPLQLEALVSARILESGKVNDGWKRPLIYRLLAHSSQKPFVLFSVGPDGKIFTQDDIDAWETQSRGRN